MLSFANKYAGNFHSQNGEDGIVAECIRRLELKDIHCVEVGANDGHWMSNTRNLIEEGASGLFVESDYALYEQCRDNWDGHPKVRAQCCHVNGKNINAFVDDRCDVLSLDTDGADYEIFKGLEAKPKIVIVEIDSSIPPDVDGFNSDGGASYRTMLNLAYLKSYFLLVHTGNLVLVDERYRGLFPEIADRDPLTEPELYFNRSWLKQEAA